MKEIIEVHFDGAAWQRERASYGFSIKEGNRWLHSDFGRVPCEAENATNSVAEHYALYKALKWLLEQKMEGKVIVIKGDSKMVISQIFRGWKCRDFRLPYYPYMVANKELVRRFADIKGKLIPREKNGQCDSLSKEGLRMEIKDGPIVSEMGSLF
jgi:ribonuclease HI